jgi:hypothetical protein
MPPKQQNRRSSRVKTPAKAAAQRTEHKTANNDDSSSSSSDSDNDNDVKNNDNQPRVPTPSPTVMTSEEKKRVKDVGNASSSYCYCKECGGKVWHNKQTRLEHHRTHGWMTAAEKKAAIAAKRKATRRGSTTDASSIRSREEQHDDGKEIKDDDGKGGQSGNDLTRSIGRSARNGRKTKQETDNDGIAAFQVHMQQQMDKMMLKISSLSSTSSPPVQAIPPPTASATATAVSATATATTIPQTTALSHELLVEVLRGTQDPERASHDQLMKLRTSIVDAAHMNVISSKGSYKQWANELLKENKWNQNRNYFEFFAWSDIIDKLVKAGFKCDHDIMRSAILRLITIQQADKSGNWRHVSIYGGAGHVQDVIPDNMMVALENKASEYIASVDKLMAAGTKITPNVSRGAGRGTGGTGGNTKHSRPPSKKGIGGNGNSKGQGI